MQELGARPELAWIDVDLLTIDSTYQRTIESRKSQALIQKLAENWVWAHCAPLIVTPSGEGEYLVIDGQHRMHGARQRGGIPDLPCYVISEMDRQAQAKAFVALNNDRIYMNPYAIFHAERAAGKPEAEALYNLCQEYGVEIPKYPKTRDTIKPNETMALGTVRKIFGAKNGAPRLHTVLRILRKAQPDNHEILRTSMIEACNRFVIRNENYNETVLVSVFADVDPMRIEAHAKVRSSESGGTTKEECAGEIQRLYFARSRGEVPKKPEAVSQTKKPSRPTAPSMKANRPGPKPKPIKRSGTPRAPEKKAYQPDPAHVGDEEAQKAAFIKSGKVTKCDDGHAAGITKYENMMGKIVFDRTQAEQDEIDRRAEARKRAGRRGSIAAAQQVSATRRAKKAG